MELMTMNEYKVYDNQCLQDIAAHVYGRVDMAMELAVLNNLSITEIIQTGRFIKLAKAPIDSLVKKALDSRNIIPTSGFNLKDLEVAEVGIGTMIIGTNFIVR